MQNPAFSLNFLGMRQVDRKAKGGYERHDPYYHAAKQKGFVARSVFKLEEIDNDFNLIRPRDKVLDLGCAPGSWLQYVEGKLRASGGQIVGVDLLPVRLSFGQNVHIIQGDIYDVQLEQLLPFGREFDVLLSDMAPNTSGIKSLDQDRSLVLCERALEIAQVLLRPGGRFCVKVLEGGGMQNFIAACRQIFQEVKIRRPKGTRAASMETYVIGLGKK